MDQRIKSRVELSDEAFYSEAAKPFVAEDWSRELICEGRCNPHLRDYDIVADRAGKTDMRGPKWVSPILTDMVRTLVHTPHNTLDNNLRFSSDFGWGRLWKCAVCGHTRHA